MVAVGPRLFVVAVGVGKTGFFWDWRGTIIVPSGDSRGVAGSFLRRARPWVWCVG